MDKHYVLVTGATGFIGSHVADRLVRDGRLSVIAIVREAEHYRNVEKLRECGAILIPGLFYDRELLEKVFNDYPVSTVIHIAAVRGLALGSEDDYHRVNVEGTRQLLELAKRHGTGKFIFCSSVGVWGTIPQEVPAHLGTPLCADNRYHMSKIQAERHVLEYRGKGLNAFIVRPTICYGPGDNGFPYTFVRLVRRRLLLLPFHEVKIHLLDVKKLAGLFHDLTIREDIAGEGIFVAADAAPISSRELADLIHMHYFGIHYPRYLRLPDMVFAAGQKICSFAKNEKWLLRVLLMSKNWSYSLDEAVGQLNYIPTETQAGFLRYLAAQDGCARA